MWGTHPQVATVRERKDIVVGVSPEVKLKIAVERKVGHEVVKFWKVEHSWCAHHFVHSTAKAASVEVV